MGLDKIIGIFLIWFVIGSVMCFLSRRAFNGVSVAVGFFAWLTIIVIPAVLTIVMCYGVMLLVR